MDYATLAAQQPVNVIATTAGLAGAPIEDTGVVVARTDWLKKNHAAAVNFLAGLLKAESSTETDVATNKAAKTIAMLQLVLKYDKPRMANYVTYRLQDIGQESKLGGLLRIPRSFVDPALVSLKSGGGLPGDRAGKARVRSGGAGECLLLAFVMMDFFGGVVSSLDGLARAFCQVCRLLSLLIVFVRVWCADGVALIIAFRSGFARHKESLLSASIVFADPARVTGLKPVSVQVASSRPNTVTPATSQAT